MQVALLLFFDEHEELEDVDGEEAEDEAEEKEVGGAFSTCLGSDYGPYPSRTWSEGFNDR